MEKTLSDAYESLKIKDKFSWVIPKVVTDKYRSSRLRELFITKFINIKSQFKWGFTNVPITRAGLLWERSQGELRLYFITTAMVKVTLIVTSIWDKYK